MLIENPIHNIVENIGPINPVVDLSSKSIYAILQLVRDEGIQGQREEGREGGGEGSRDRGMDGRERRAGT